MMSGSSRHTTPPSPALFAFFTVILLRLVDAFIGQSIHSCCRTRTLLENKSNHIEYSDFAAYGDNTQQEQEVQKLTEEFYEEVRLRQARSSVVRDTESMRIEKKDSLTYLSSKPDDRSPLVALLSFLNPPPSPPSSAGLFSGKGKTAYSSGRSLRAEVQLLESSFNKHETGAGLIRWDGVYVDNSPDQFEKILKATAGTLTVLAVAYLAMGLRGEFNVAFPWEEAATSGTSVLIVLSERTESISSLVVEDPGVLVSSMGQAVIHTAEELIVR